jgi:hypothetical protein
VLIRISWLLECLGWAWTLRCPECGLPGHRGARAEVDLLTRVHNLTLHRGRPVAAARFGLVSR